MTLKLPRAWATSANYTTGPDAGSPTCVNPSSDLNGFVRGVVAAPQHVNFHVSALTAAARNAWAVAALHLRELRLEGTLGTDLAESLAAISIDPAKPILAIKADLSRWVTSWSRPETMDLPQGIDANVRDVATDGAGRVWAVGTDTALAGFGSSVSTDNGASWSTGTSAAGLFPLRAVYSENSNRFVASLTGAGSEYVLTTPNGEASDSSIVATGLAANGGGGGIAVLNAGESDVLAICGEATGALNRPFFRRSINGGAAWTTGVQAAAGVYQDFGCVVGNGGPVAYHVGTATGSASIIVSAITAGGSGLGMTTLSTLLPPSGVTFSASIDPRILMCRNTGLLVVASLLSNGYTALYASLDATDWVGPVLISPGFPTVAFALAGGRLFATRNDMIFASDGIGS